jgi:hypothetical protein
MSVPEALMYNFLWASGLFMVNLKLGFLSKIYYFFYDQGTFTKGEALLHLSSFSEEVLRGLLLPDGWLDEILETRDVSLSIAS